MPKRQEVTENGARRVLIVAAVMAAALMQTLDSTITNVALPTIQGNLGADQDEGTWIVTTYSIAAIMGPALGPPLGGILVDNCAARREAAATPANGRSETAVQSA